MKLTDIEQCFRGIIPSAIQTCSSSGIPNVAYLSEVYLVDGEHVALTSQYFNKTQKNLLENPWCTLRVADPETFVTYRLKAKRERTEKSGPLFDEMKTRLAAIADYSGASDLLKLEAAEILSVSEVSEILGEAVHDTGEAPLQKPQFSVAALQNTTERLNAALTLDDVFDSILRSMDLEFGFRNSMVFLYDTPTKKLLTLASRGYEESGVGAEVRLGEGVIGRAAETRKPLVYTTLLRELIYARSVHARSVEAGVETGDVVPLPGLANSQSQIAIPLVLRGELLGVLFAESQQIFEFRDSDDRLLRTLGSFLALAVQSLSTDENETAAPASAPSVPKKSGETLNVSYFKADDSVFINGEYVIRNTPARILWKFLNEYSTTGKTEFTNRELRLDASLELPEIKDNLEARLILLRKRLEQKCPSVKIASAGRGRMILSVDATLKLETK